MRATKKKGNAALSGTGGAQRGERWVSATTLAKLAGLRERTARWIISLALAGKKWRGALLQVRQVPCRGGAAGTQHEVLLSLLPPDLQAEWYKLHPAGLPAGVSEQLADREEKRASAAERWAWTQEDRERRHAAYSQLPSYCQEEAKRRLPWVRLFDSLFAPGLPIQQRYGLVAKESGESASTIRRWVKVCRGLDRGDWVVALAPKPHGRERAPEAPFSQEARAFIWSEYFRLTKPALKAIYRRAVRLAKEHGWSIPSYATVLRLIKAEPHPLLVLKREGQEAFEALYPTQRRDYSTLEAHEIWVCDARRADAFCKWEDGTVSRPMVITFMDVRTRVVLSRVISRTENADAVRIAFKAAAEKARAIPRYVLLDNSRAFASRLLSAGAPNRFRGKVREEDLPGIFTLLGIQIIWALPYSGRSKPIESFHRHYAEAERRLDGAYCGNRPDARPEDCDPAKAVPIEKYSRLLDETIAMYHATPHRGDAMGTRTPLEVYEALIQQCNPRRPSREQLALCLLAADSVRLEPETGAIRLMGNRYWNEKCAELPRDREYCVRFNPEDATEAVSIYEGERFICEASLIERTGFRDQQAAKDHARAKRQNLKRHKQQVDARLDMSKARHWGTLPGEFDTEVKEALLPTPKVVTPLRPGRDYRQVKPEKPDISNDDFLQIILDNAPRRANER